MSSLGFLKPPVKQTRDMWSMRVSTIKLDDHRCKDLSSQPKCTLKRISCTDAYASITVGWQYMVSANPEAAWIRNEVNTSPPKQQNMLM